MDTRQLIIGIIFAFLTGVASGFSEILAGPITNTENGHVYFLLSSNSWTASEVEARSLGGHLATVRNSTEENWLDSTYILPTRFLSLSRGSVPTGAQNRSPITVRGSLKGGEAMASV